MKQIDRLITKELIGPWVFGIGMFTSLIFAATYLGRIAGFIVQGAPITLVLEVMALYMPAMLVKTFSMSMLLAGLLSFGRLSSDSELVALRAGGASLTRILAPVAAFSLLVAIVTMFFNETVVPGANAKSVALTTEMSHMQNSAISDPKSQPIFENRVLKAIVNAQSATLATSTLNEVAVIAYNAKGVPTDAMTAPQMQYSDVNDWVLPMGGRITSLSDPVTVKDVHGKVWPNEIPTLHATFADLLKPRDDDFDSYSMSVLRSRIVSHERLGDKSPSELANYEYGYWNKLSLPLAALVFGLLGAVLGIRNHRTGNAAGFALAIAIIFGYFMLANFMNVWAQGGVIPAWVASFAPLVIGLAATGVIMWRRNS
jgi:lipopolysaccharide export system permease protein